MRLVLIHDTAHARSAPSTGPDCGTGKQAGFAGAQVHPCGSDAEHDEVMDIRAIGWVRSSRTEAVDDDWDNVVSTIELDSTIFTPEALRGLDEFSHIEVVYLFDRVDPTEVQVGARHPRNNPAWPMVGIFAQRAKSRPNRLGLCTCALRAVRDLTLGVMGLDAIDGTPVLDLKPYMIEFGPRGPVRQPTWSHELMFGYWTQEAARSD